MRGRVVRKKKRKVTRTRGNKPQEESAEGRDMSLEDARTLPYEASIRDVEDSIEVLQRAGEGYETLVKVRQKRLERLKDEEKEAQ